MSGEQGRLPARPLTPEEWEKFQRAVGGVAPSLALLAVKLENVREALEETARLIREHRDSHGPDTDR